MTVIEFNSETGVRQYFRDETLELQKFFFRHVTILLIDWPNAAHLNGGRAPGPLDDAGTKPTRFRFLLLLADRDAAVYVIRVPGDAADACPAQDATDFSFTLLACGGAERA